MKNDKLDTIGFVDSQLIEKAEKYTCSKKKNTWVKWSVIAACFCLAVAGVVSITPQNNLKTGEWETGGSPVAGGAYVGAPVPGGDKCGEDFDVMYSVAVFPAEVKREDINAAHCEKITETEAQREEGIGSLMPTALPDGFHFDFASIYVTTMNDGTVYKRLLITYRTGEGAVALPDEDGAVIGPGHNDLGEEFRINIFSFKPDTSAGVYSLEDAKKELSNDNFEKDFFFIQYGDYYVGIEPLSLSAEAIIGLIDSIGR